MCALHMGCEVIILSQQPSQQDWESRFKLVPLLEQVTEHSQGQSQRDRGIYLAEGKFCGNKREANNECAAWGQPRDALQNSGNVKGLR